MAHDLLICTVVTTKTPTPTGAALDFAAWLAESVTDGDFMEGSRTSYKVFFPDDLKAEVEDYADDRDLSDAEVAEIWVWLNTLPRTDADTLELFFSW
ncbi:MAG: hypothetical protein OXN15_08405 [Chloroflexota bacterium]|nr:hypothetical protein [Chloroflexota bacterium]MDE2968638.1 hypothetical protein [Chloroflexota bacterium]